MEPQLQSQLSRLSETSKATYVVDNVNSNIQEKIFKELYFALHQPISQETIEAILRQSANKEQSSIVQKIQQIFFREENRQVNKKFCGKNYLQIIKRLIKNGIPKEYINAYFKLAQNHYQSFINYFNKQDFQQYTRTIPLCFIENFVKLLRFKLKEDLLNFRNKTALQQVIQKSENFGRAIKFALQYLRNNFNGKQFKRYNDFLLRLTNEQNNSQVKLQLQKNAAVYFLKKQGWEIFQQVCGQRPQLLAFGVQILLKNQQDSGFGLSICHRNPRVISKLKPRSKRLIQSEMAQIAKKGLNPILNQLAHNEFRPSSQSMIHIQQFGVKRQNIRIVNYNIPLNQIEEIMAHINDQKIIAIDTESKLIKTKLCKQEDVLALIQVAVKGNVYLFDAFDINKSAVTKKGFQKFLSQKDNKILGHALSNDIGVLRKILRITQPQACQVIQIKSLLPKFKNIKSPSLSNLCLQVFNKELCKKYTKTNWARRPLLQNQIHYAALDAYIILQMFNRLTKSNQ